MSHEKTSDFSKKKEKEICEISASDRVAWLARPCQPNNMSIKIMSHLHCIQESPNCPRVEASYFFCVMIILSQQAESPFLRAILAFFQPDLDRALNGSRVG
jgi:hypothetical protein